jgi:hypothetical protein
VGWVGVDDNELTRLIKWLIGSMSNILAQHLNKSCLLFDKKKKNIIFACWKNT